MMSFQCPVKGLSWFGVLRDPLVQSVHWGHVLPKGEGSLVRGALGTVSGCCRIGGIVYKGTLYLIPRGIVVVLRISWPAQGKVGPWGPNLPKVESAV